MAKDSDSKVTAKSYSLDPVRLETKPAFFSSTESLASSERLTRTMSWLPLRRDCSTQDIRFKSCDNRIRLTESLAEEPYLQMNVIKHRSFVSHDKVGPTRLLMRFVIGRKVSTHIQTFGEEVYQLAWYWHRKCLLEYNVTKRRHPS